MAAITAVREHPVLLLTDFDGTLCEFKNTPDAVMLSAPRRVALSALAIHPMWSVGIVSGRRAKDVRQRASLSGSAYYAGLHGMEIDGPDRQFQVPDFGALRDEIQRVGNALAEATAAFPGALLENKDLSVALHVRAASPRDRRRHGAAAFPIYLGDDRTDEHAFDAVGDRGRTGVVGSRPSQARYRLPDPSAIEQLLTRLAARYSPH